MNILIINPILHTPTDGKIKRCATIKHTMIYNFVLGFLKSGHQATLVAVEEYKPSQEEIYDFPVVFLPTVLKWLPKGFPVYPALKKFLRKNMSYFDLIVSSEVFSYGSFIAAKICPKKLLIWHELGQHAPTFWQLPSKFWYNVVGNLYFRKKILIVPRSEIAKNFISRYCNIVANPIEHGINVDNFLFIKKKQRYFIVVAQLIPRKNIEAIISKFIAFITKYKNLNFKLLIAGDGPLKDTLENRINSLKMNKRIFLLGQLPPNELAKVMGHACGLLIDSFYEFNIVSLSEALCCGTPVVTNMIPYRAPFINDAGVGIAKNNWNEDDLYYLITHLDIYIDNCKCIRNTLSNIYLSERMVEEFKRYSYNENIAYK